LEQTGVYEIAPRTHEAFRFKETIVVDGVKVSQEAMWKVLEKLIKKYQANEYHMLMFNCNHFVDELLQGVSQGRERLPLHLNRAANLGGYLHWMVPLKYMVVTPMDGDP
jgi:PPPDE putative peptidase domain